MIPLSDQQILEMRIASQGMLGRVASVVQDRNESGFYALCDESLASERVHFLIGIVRAYMTKDSDSFEWMMYCLSKVKGYEEIVASFWIVNWQLRMSGTP